MSAINVGSIYTELGARLDRREFIAYDRQLEKTRAAAAKREHFRAQLGADFDARTFNSYNRELAKAERQTHDVSGRIRGSLKSIAGAAGVGAAVSGVAGLGLALKGIGSATVDFDKGMRNVNSIAQLSEKQLGSLSKRVLDLAGKTAQAPKTLADGLYDLVSSGFDANESMTILAASAKAATAGLTTTEVSTKAVAAVLNAYHRPAKDAADVSDTLFQTVNLGVVSFENLATTIGDVLPFASSLGVNVNQVGASLSTMTKEGLSAEEAATRVKNVMVALLKPNNDLAKAIKATGYESGESLVKAKGYQGALEAIVGTTDGSKRAVAQLFPNIRALGGALAVTGGNAKSAEKDLAAFKDTGGATDKALSQQSQSIAYKWQKVKAQFSAVAIELGTKMAPAAITAIKAVSKFVDQMEHGRGAGGRFVSTVKDIGSTLAGIGHFVKDHIGLIKAAAEAWGTYKLAVIAAGKVSAARALLGAGGAAATTGAGAVVGRTAAGRVIGGAGGVSAGIAVAGGIKAVTDAIHGNDFSDKGLLAQFSKRIEEVQAKGDKSGMRRLAEDMRRVADANRDLTKGSNLRRIAQDLDDMASGAKHFGTDVGGALKKAQDHFDDFRRTGSNDLKGIRSATADNMHFIRRTLDTDSAEGKDALAKNFRLARSAVRQAMQDGQVSVRDGLREIQRLMRAELKQYGITGGVADSIIKHGDIKPEGNSQAQDFSGIHAHIPETKARGGFVRRLARGGWLGSRGDVGMDDVPIGGGALAARGEFHAAGRNMDAILNRHQQPVADAALAAGGFGGLAGLARMGPGTDQVGILNSVLGGVGGLRGLFSAITTPHYLAAGGFAGGGGHYSKAQLEALWVQAGGPRSLAPLMAAIALAESGGDPNVVNSIGATGLWQIHPGGSQYLDPLANARTAVSKYKTQGLAAWEAYTNGSYRSFLGAGATASVAGGVPSVVRQIAARIRAPRTGSKGALGQIVQAGLDRVATAATRRVQSALDAAGGGVGPTSGPAGTASFDGYPVARWIIPELLWARAHGWAGRVTSGWRDPRQVVHGVFATAPQGQSEHQGTQYPHGAVDVSDYGRFASIIRGYPGARRLIQLGIDPLHFSGTGHAAGGFVRRFAGGGFNAGFGGQGPTRRAAPPHRNLGAFGGQGPGTKPPERVTRLATLQVSRIGEFDSLQVAVDDLGTRYQQADRAYGQSDEVLIDPKTGQVDDAAVRKRAGELDALIGIREQIIAKYQRMIVVAQRVVATYKVIIRRLTASLSFAKTKDRGKILASIGKYTDDLNTWQTALHDLSVQTLPDAQLDLGDIQNERASVLGTTADTSGASGTSGQDSAVLDQVQRRLDLATTNATINAKALQAFASPGDIGVGSPSSSALAVASGGRLGTGPAPASLQVPGGDGTAITVQIHSLVPPSGAQAKQVADAVVSAISQQPNIPSSTTNMGA